MEQKEVVFSSTTENNAGSLMARVTSSDKIVNSRKVCDEGGSIPGLSGFETGVQASDGDCLFGADWVDSEPSAGSCASASDASSNALNYDLLVSDADSSGPTFGENVAEKCPSGGSIVTCDEVMSRCYPGDPNSAIAREGSGKRNFLRPLEEQERSLNTALDLEESGGKAWTEDEHCSYLNSIEATFVRSLYELDHRTVDMSEQDQDCVESQPLERGFHIGDELFTSLQRGCYDQREYYRPHHIFASTPAVFSSPWIQHFSPRTLPPGFVSSGAQEFLTGNLPSTSGFSEAMYSSYLCHGGSEDSVPLVADSNNRYQSLMIHNVRPENRAQGKRSTCCVAPCREDSLHLKKAKSTQQKLAKTDVELEEQYVLGQLYQKEDGIRADYNDLGWRTVSSGAPSLSVDEQTCAQGNLTSTAHVSLVHEANTELDQGYESSANRMEELGSEDKPQECQALPEFASDRSKEGGEGVCRLSQDYSLPDNLENPCHDSFCSGGERELAVEMFPRCHPSKPGGRFSGSSQVLLSLEGSTSYSQQDAGDTDDEDRLIVTKTSPFLSSRTYTWGVFGSRRPFIYGNNRAGASCNLGHREEAVPTAE